MNDKLSTVSKWCETFSNIHTAKHKLPASFTEVEACISEPDRSSEYQHFTLMQQTSSNDLQALMIYISEHHLSYESVLTTP